VVHGEREGAQDIHAQQACAAIRPRQIAKDDGQIPDTEALDV